MRKRAGALTNRRPPGVRRGGCAAGSPLIALGSRRAGARAVTRGRDWRRASPAERNAAKLRAGPELCREGGVDVTGEAPDPRPRSAVRLGKVSLSRVCHPQPRRRRHSPTPAFFFGNTARPRHVGEPTKPLGNGAIMLGRHVYRVSPADKGWTVSKEGEDRPRASFQTRDEAMDEAVRLARSDQPARVTVDNGQGLILEEKLFGADPGTELGPQ